MFNLWITNMWLSYFFFQRYINFMKKKKYL